MVIGRSSLVGLILGPVTGRQVQQSKWANAAWYRLRVVTGYFMFKRIGAGNLNNKSHIIISFVYLEGGNSFMSLGEEKAWDFYVKACSLMSRCPLRRGIHPPFPITCPSNVPPTFACPDMSLFVIASLVGRDAIGPVPKPGPIFFSSIQ